MNSNRASRSASAPAGNGATRPRLEAWLLPLAPALLAGFHVAGLLLFLNPRLPLAFGTLARAAAVYGALLAVPSIAVHLGLARFGRRPVRRLLPWTLTAVAFAGALGDWVHASYYSFYLPAGINNQLIKTALWLTGGALLVFYTALLHTIHRRRYGLRQPALPRAGRARHGLRHVRSAHELPAAGAVAPRSGGDRGRERSASRPGRAAERDARRDPAARRAGQAPLLSGADRVRRARATRHARAPPAARALGDARDRQAPAPARARGGAALGGLLAAGRAAAPAAARGRLRALGPARRRRARRAPQRPRGAAALDDARRARPAERGARLPRGARRRGRRRGERARGRRPRGARAPGARLHRPRPRARRGPRPARRRAAPVGRRSRPRRALPPARRSRVASLACFGGFAAAEFEGERAGRVRRAADALATYYGGLDGELAELWAALPEPRLLIVVSPYGVRASAGVGRILLALADRPRLRGRLEGAPDGLFLARGEGIRLGVQVPAAALADVVPTLLYALGLPIARDLDGKVLAASFEPALLQRRSLAFVPSYEGLAAPAALSGP